MEHCIEVRPFLDGTGTRYYFETMEHAIAFHATLNGADYPKRAIGPIERYVVLNWIA